MKTKSKNMPSKEKILSTWWITRDDSGVDLLASKTNGKAKIPPETDRCWCCGCLENHPWYKNVGVIERCHIVPKSLGGSNDPLNLVLLCSQCHKKSPDTNLPEIMFDWFESEHDKRNMRAEKTTEAFVEHFPTLAKPGNVDKSMRVVIAINKVRQSEGFSNYFIKNSSAHFGVAEKLSSEFGLLKNYIKENKIDVGCKVD
jgi:hypothetical protein